MLQLEGRHTNWKIRSQVALKWGTVSLETRDSRWSADKNKAKGTNRTSVCSRKGKPEQPTHLEQGTQY